MRNKIFLLLIITGSLLLYSCGTKNLSEQDNNPPAALLEEENNEIAIETTSVPQEAITKEATPSASPTNMPDSSQINPQLDSKSLCYHPYFPIIDGASWTFNAMDDEDYTLRIEETGENSFTMIQEMTQSDAIYSAEWYCSEEGILRGTFGQLDLLNQAAGGEETPEFEFEAIEWEGETLPSSELIELGYAWTSNYILSANLEIEGISQTSEVRVSINHKISAIESVTVPAGTFPEAVRVDSHGEIEMILVIGESTIPFSGLDFNYSTWYVEGLGMVKSSNIFSGYANDVVLTESSLID
jgi:hypothetical protein